MGESILQLRQIRKSFDNTEVLITIHSDIFLFFIRNYIINFDVFTQTTSAIIWNPI